MASQKPRFMFVIVKSSTKPHVVVHSRTALLLTALMPQCTFVSGQYLGKCVPIITNVHAIFTLYTKNCKTMTMIIHSVYARCTMTWDHCKKRSIVLTLPSLSQFHETEKTTRSLKQPKIFCSDITDGDYTINT